MRERDDRADDRVAAAAADRADEAAIDLQCGNRELVQGGERGVAGSEVVEVDPDAGRAREDIVRRIRSGSCISVLSVISRCSALAGTPALATARRMFSESAGSSSWRPDTLTLTPTPSATRPRRRQDARSVSAPASTWSPRAPITPVSSAIVTNSVGATSGHASGQRASASKP